MLALLSIVFLIIAVILFTIGMTWPAALVVICAVLCAINAFLNDYIRRTIVIPIDNWVIFALELAEPPSEKHPGVYVMWAGTNRPDVNETMCQLYPEFAANLETIDGLAVVSETEAGMYFSVAEALHKDDDFHAELREALELTARHAATQLQCEFYAAPVELSQRGFLQILAGIMVDLRRNPPTPLDYYDGEVAEEEK